MKKLYFLCMMAVLLLNTTPINAAKSIWILGKEYSSDFKSEDGSIEWKHSTNSLYLKDVNIDIKSLDELYFRKIGAKDYPVYHIFCSENITDDITIYLEGNNIIKCENLTGFVENTWFVSAFDFRDANINFDVTDKNTVTKYPSIYVKMNNQDAAGYIIRTTHDVALKNCDFKFESQINYYEGNVAPINTHKITFDRVNVDISELGSVKDNCLSAYYEPTYNNCTLMTENIVWGGGYFYETLDGAAVTELSIRRNSAIKFGDMTGISPKTPELNSETPDAKITSGTASYDFNTNTLTLKNLVAEKLDVSEASLTIKVEGECSFTNELDVRAATTITGTGTLNLPFMATYSSPLEISELKQLNVENPSGVGISGNSKEGAGLHINKSNVKISGKTQAVNYLQELTLTDCIIVSPDGCEVKDNNFRVGSTIQQSVEIIVGELYGFVIQADGIPTKVHSANCSEIPFNKYDKENKSSDGYISFSGNTLTLHKVSEDYKIVVINNSQDNLTITSDGSSTIQRIVARANTTISGSNKLTIKGPHTDGLIELNELSPDPDPDKVKGVTLKFNQANVVLDYTGNSHAIYAHSTSTESRERNKIDIYDSDIKITTDPEKPVLEGLYLWSIDRAEITAPAGAKFSKDDQSIIDKDGNKVVKLTITGGEDLDISIGGDPINSRDAEKEGFDERTHTLTLEKAKIKGGSEPAISTGYDDLTILLIGDNVLESKNNNVIEMPAKSTLTIKSGDTKSEDMPTLSLTTGGGKNAKGALWLNGKGSVLIEGVSVEATNDEGAGIASKSSATLTIRNANVTVQG
ncbi:MAG: hypothetical protein IJ834_02200, partial [Paludibacteraceae bacterium]|nr:hypothetical protein [Paludibacteraceae bacterium]